MKLRALMLTLVLAVAAGIVFWQLSRRPARSTVSQPSALKPSAPPAVASSVPAAPAAVPVSPAAQVELAATEHMYAAHAPLRMPEVANPDSATNRQILQTMVTKALAQSAMKPATN